MFIHRISTQSQCYEQSITTYALDLEVTFDCHMNLSVYAFTVFMCPFYSYVCLIIESFVCYYRSETPVLYQVLPEKRMDRVGGAMMASTHIYDMTGAAGPPPVVTAPTRRGPGGPEGSGTVELALDPSELDLVDTDAMAVRYEQQIREQQSQLQKEDLSDMLADHVARQKVCC